MSLPTAAQLAGAFGKRHDGGVRVVGKRRAGVGDREGLDALARKFGGGAPKGVFRYKTAEEANRDQDRWMIERARQRTKTSAES